MKVFRYSHKKIGNYFCHKVYVTKTGFETNRQYNKYNQSFGFIGSYQYSKHLRG